MHGVRREDVSDDGPDADECARVAEYRALYERVLTEWRLLCRSEAENDRDAPAVSGGATDAPAKPGDALPARGGPRQKTSLPELLSLTHRAVLLNPDFQTAWALRRAALRGMGTGVLASELEINVDAIRAGPKSYCAWAHRRWVVDALAPGTRPVAHELGLCDKLLALDGRNFHCWNYRLWLAGETRAEFEATTRHIYANFSNYSAWQRRAALLPPMLAMDGAALWDAEAQLVRAAYWTQPRDQAVWFYLRLLVGLAADPRTAAASELAELEKLLADEPDAPLALATGVHLARVAGAVADAGRIRRLMAVDSLRAGMYADWLADLGAPS